MTWEIEPSPEVAGATQSDLGAVSCPTLTTCIAVGSETNVSFTSSTLAEEWTGTNWTIEPTPDAGSPDTQYQDLAAVSCTSPIACTAVGETDFPTETLAERWNGVDWTIQPTP